MEDFFYNGIWRMDWGLGNPNKTAIIIAELMISAWGIAYIKKYGFIIASIAFLLLGMCLIHTFSRGGIVALMAGCITLSIAYRMQLSKKKGIVIFVIFFILLSYSFFLSFHKRCVSGDILKDRSITNRIEVWKSVPYMIADAPLGWGWGQSGSAFMKWYQSPERVEPYRTLVNSHFTWLVEGNWWFRGAYIFFWCLICLLCVSNIQTKLWFSFSLALWICFGVGAFFSSVAESPFLWIIPVISTLPVIYFQLHLRSYISLLVALSLSLLFCFSTYVLFHGKSNVLFYNNYVTLGNGSPKIWIVVNEKLLGQYEYAKAFRLFFIKHPEQKQPIAFVNRLNDIPKGIFYNNILLIAGISQNDELIELKSCQNQFEKIYLLSPQLELNDLQNNLIEIKKIKIFFGEYSQSPYLIYWYDFQMITIRKTCGDFFSDIPCILFSN